MWPFFLFISAFSLFSPLSQTFPCLLSVLFFIPFLHHYPSSGLSSSFFLNHTSFSLSFYLFPPVPFFFISFFTLTLLLSTFLSSPFSIFLISHFLSNTPPRPLLFPFPLFIHIQSSNFYFLLCVFPSFNWSALALALLFNTHYLASPYSFFFFFFPQFQIPLPRSSFLLLVLSFFPYFFLHFFLLLYRYLHLLSFVFIHPFSPPHCVSIFFSLVLLSLPFF